MSHLSRTELIDSLEATLPAARQAHADQCPHCRDERAALQAVLSDVRRVDVPEPSPLFWEHLSARVRAQVNSEPLPASPGWLSWLTSHRALSATATVALCVIVSWAGLQELRSSRVSRYFSSSAARSSLSLPSTDRADASGVPTGADDETLSAAESAESVGTSAARSADDLIVGDEGDASLAGENTGADRSVGGRGAQASRTRGGAVLRTASVSDADWNLMVGLVDDVAWDDDAAAGSMGGVHPGATDAVVGELSTDERQELARLLREEMARRPPSS